MNDVPGATIVLDAKAVDVDVCGVVELVFLVELDMIGTILALISAYNVEGSDMVSCIVGPMNAVRFLFQVLLYIFGTRVFDIVIMFGSL